MRSKLLLESIDVNLRAQLAVRQRFGLLQVMTELKLSSQLSNLLLLAYFTRDIESYVQGKPATLAQTAATTRAAILNWLLEQILVDSKFRLVVYFAFRRENYCSLQKYH